MKSTRRKFLGASGALGLAAASGLGAYGLRRPAALAAPVDAFLSMGAIFFVLNGGARSQSIFNGRVGLGANPYGQVPTDPTTAAALPVPMPNNTTANAGVLPNGDPCRLTNININQHVNTVMAQHFNRTGNHTTGRDVACTGWPVTENKPGLLTLINYNFNFRSIPCINIGSDTPNTNVGSEVSTTFAPVKISNAGSVTSITDSFIATQASPAETDRIEALRYALEDRFHRQTRYQAPEDIPFFQRKAEFIAQQLSADALDIGDGAAEMGTRISDATPVTNGELQAMFGTNSLCQGAHLAVRLRQLGVAGISLSSGNFDTHSNEANSLPGRAQAVTRAIAGLIAALSDIADPYDPNLTMLDTTVITVMSDFGRGNWSVGTGYNGNGGSDHQSNNDKTAIQCIPIIGGGLPGSKALGEIGADGSAIGAAPVYTTRQVLSTVLDLMGIPPQTFYPDDPSFAPDLM